MVDRDNSEEQQQHRERFNSSRLIAFSDGVIAVAITLLVFNIKLPQKGLSGGQLSYDLSHSLLLSVLVYLYSYLVIANYWTYHQRIFHYIQQWDGYLFLWNLLFLASLVFLPVPTALFLVYGGVLNGNPGVWIFYAATQATTGLMLFLVWFGANRRKLVYIQDAPPSYVTYLSLRLLVVPFVFVISIGLARVSVTLAELSFVLVFLLYRLLRRIYKQEWKFMTRAIANDRLIAISDGIIGVAMTFLVANITNILPLSASSSTLTTLWSTIRTQTLIYGFSFVVVGLYWLSHHRLFDTLQRQDRHLISLNFVFLLCIELLPIANGLYVLYPKQPIATIIYAGSQTVTGLMLLVMWVYAAWGHRLIDPMLDGRQIRRIGIRTAVPPIMFLASVGVTFINTDYVPYIWFTVVVVQVYVRLRHRRTATHAEVEAVSQ